MQPSMFAADKKKPVWTKENSHVLIVFHYLYVYLQSPEINGGELPASKLLIRSNLMLWLSLIRASMSHERGALKKKEEKKALASRHEITESVNSVPSSVTSRSG